MVTSKLNSTTALLTLLKQCTYTVYHWWQAKMFERIFKEKDMAVAPTLATSSMKGGMQCMGTPGGKHRANGILDEVKMCYNRATDWVEDWGDPHVISNKYI